MEHYQQLQLSRISKLQRDLADIRILPNPASKGSEAEAALKRVLRSYLPKKYSIGSGFIYCERNWSHQHDIIIYDELINAAVYQGEISGLYPVGSVYGVVETSLAPLTKDKLIDDIKKISNLRKIIPREKIKFVRMVKKKHPSGNWVVSPKIFESGPPPRTFMIYLSGTSSYKTIEELAADLQDVGVKAGGHVHGLLIVDVHGSEKIPIMGEWFLNMEAYENGRVEHTKVDGFYKFIDAMKNAFSSLRVGKYQGYDYYDFVSKIDVS